MTSVLVEGKPAAIDMGCIFQNKYTLLAGGTDSAFKGIAKVINLRHMQIACDEHYQEVDFLCGDFSWKKIFRLATRPLYQIKSLS